MSTLSEHDKAALRLLALPCRTPGCPCDAWKTQVADLVRSHAPEQVSDAELALILLRISGHLSAMSFAHDLHGAQVGGVLAGAAAHLAVLEIGELPQ